MGNMKTFFHNLTGKRTIGAICLLLFITLLLGCEKLPDNYKISIGCGGGFAGTHQSYTVAQDGTVYYSVQSSVDPNQNREGMIIGDISKTDVIEYYSRLADIEFMNIDYVNPDNMSCSLGLTVGETIHSVTWPMMFNETEPPDEIKTIVDIFKDIDKMVSPLKPG